MTTTLRTSCPPRHGTPRSPDRETLGPAVAKIAAKLGKPFMPWQHHVVDVILELDPETGCLAYDEWGLVVPRQSGKSTVVESKSAHRCTATGFFGRRQRLVYTAQTRAKAREKWEEEFAADLLASPMFKSRVQLRLGNGNEHMRFLNGSRFGIEATTEDAGHGGTLDEVYIDEAFAQKDDRLEHAFGPAMITRPNTQLAWISTAGWKDESPFLEDKVKLGRAMVAAGKRSGLAYFEWSADPDADPGDPATWWSCMPALGHTVTEAAIRSVYDKAVAAKKLNGFKRAYLNLWVPKDAVTEDADPGPVSVTKWLGQVDDDPEHAPKRMTSFSIEIDIDRAFTSIGVAGTRFDELTHLELVEHARGTGWVVDYCKELNALTGAAVFAIDGHSQASSLIEDLREAGLNIVVMSAADVVKACGDIVDAVDQGTERHGTQKELDDAVRGCKKRRLANRFAFGRKTPTDNVSPLNAVTFARWLHNDLDYDLGDSIL